VARIAKKKCLKVMMGKIKEKKLLGRLGDRCGDNIKMDLQK
jgi:hypothetical protein